MTLTLDLVGLVFVVWIAIIMNRQLEFSGFKRETFTPQRAVTGMKKFKLNLLYYIDTRKCCFLVFKQSRGDFLVLK